MYDRSGQIQKMAEDVILQWCGSLLFNYLEFLKCSQHKSVFHVTVFMDCTARYWSKINKSLPQLVAAFQQDKLIVAMGTI